jgi:hypothetical protein
MIIVIRGGPLNKQQNGRVRGPIAASWHEQNPDCSANSLPYDIRRSTPSTMNPRAAH